MLSVVVLWAVSTAVFCMMRFLPGDPVAVMLQTSGASPARIAELRHQLGLDQPIQVQYMRFLSGIVRGDLGNSIFTGRPVVEVILEQLPATMQLAISSMIIGVLVGMVLGIISALREGSWIDNLSMIFAATGVSMPSFWLGLMMIYLFSLRLNWFPATGQGGIDRLIMPATVLGLGVSATIARLTRSSLIEVMQQEYIITGRSKGLTERVVILRHALKNALIPVVTMVGLEFGWLLGGAVVTETVFSRQGLGRLAVQAVLWKDFPLVQGTVLFAAVFYLIANLVVDILYSFLDPRIGTQ
jgi:ABC-type dipeptide/oligopeptide/nickel transport system permease component